MNVISVDPGLECTGLYVFRNGEGTATSVRRGGRAGYDHLVELRKVVMLHARGCHAALVEDYAYSRLPGGGKSAMEAGATVRTALAEVGLPPILVNPAIWKARTIGNMPKDTVGEKVRYLETVRKAYGKAFDTTDEADAFLIYLAALVIWYEGAESPAQEQLRALVGAAVERAAAVVAAR